MNKNLILSCIFLLHTSFEHAVNNSLVGVRSNVSSSIKTVNEELNHIFLFAHGLAATKNQINLFIKEHKKDGILMYNNNYIIDLPYVSFDFPDSVHAIDPSAWFLPLRRLISSLIRGNYDQTSFGQANEIELLHAIYTEKISQDKKVIYGGISRGASIFFTWPSLYKSTNIVAGILESPYACIADVINLKRKQFGIEGVMSEEHGQYIMELLFGRYKRSGIKPIDCVHQVDQNIALLIVAAKSDGLVPWESSFLLYQALQQAGHKKVHFLLLDEGDHGFLLSGPNGKKYQQVAHAFMRYYDIPHDNTLAEAGHNYFITNLLS